MYGFIQRCLILNFLYIRFGYKLYETLVLKLTSIEQHKSFLKMEALKLGNSSYFWDFSL